MSSMARLRNGAMDDYNCWLSACVVCDLLWNIMPLKTGCIRPPAHWLSCEMQNSFSGFKLWIIPCSLGGMAINEPSSCTFQKSRFHKGGGKIAAALACVTTSQVVPHSNALDVDMVGLKVSTECEIVSVWCKTVGFRVPGSITMVVINPYFCWDEF